MVSHYDTDGITSATILLKYLLGTNLNFHLRIVKHLTQDVCEEISVDEDWILVFLDLGSGHVDLIKNFFDVTKVFVLDHHVPTEHSHPNFFHFNPMFYGIDDLSASMVTYLFVGALDEKLKGEVVDLAVVGGVGDLKGGFGKNSRKIVDEGVELGKVVVERGIKLYGRYSRPIHKALEYSYEPYIPGITGSESNAVQFLAEHGIKVKEGDKWRRLCDLTLEEQRKLATAIIIERLRWKEEDAGDIFGDNYTLVERPVEIKDAQEFSTLLNACSRMKRWDVGIRVCLGDEKALEEASRILEEYRKKLADYLEMVRSGECIVETKKATFVRGEERIEEDFISTIVSILAVSDIASREKPIFGLAVSDDGSYVKVSGRVPKGCDVNIRDLLAEVCAELGGSGGGHRVAAGGMIPRGEEENFINLVEKRLDNHEH